MEKEKTTPAQEESCRCCHKKKNDAKEYIGSDEPTQPY